MTRIPGFLHLQEAKQCVPHTLKRGVTLTPFEVRVTPVWVVGVSPLLGG